MTKTAETTALTVFERVNPLVVLQDEAKFNRFYDEMKAETDKHIPNLETKSGRDAIASLAFKVARTKTAIDEAGKKLTEEWRGKINVVDVARREIRNRLDALKDEVRAPLTKWEEAEEARREKVRVILETLKSAAIVQIDESAEGVVERLTQLRAYDLAEDVFQEYHSIAEATRAQSVKTLEAAHGRLLKEESERAELMRLRQEQAEREEREAAERAETQRKAAEAAAERERQEREAREAQERKDAIAAAERRAAEAARQQAEDAHRQQIEAERARADAAEAEQRRQAEAAEAAEQQRRVEAKRLADEQEARDRDRKHRGKIMAEAKIAIVALGVGEDPAKKIVLAIVAHEIPNVTLRF